MNYWETKDALKELYVKAVQDPHVAWHLEYLKEKSKRIEIEEKYERLTRKIKENAVKEVSEREGSEVNIPVNEKYMTLLRQGTSVSFPVCCSLEGIRSLKLTYEVEGEFGKLVEERLEDESEPIRVDIDSLATMQEDRDQWKELAKYYGRLLEMEE